MGPDPDTLRDIAAQALAVMHASPLMRTTNSDWGERVPSLRFALDQDLFQTLASMYQPGGKSMPAFTKPNRNSHGKCGENQEAAPDTNQTDRRL